MRWQRVARIVVTIIGLGGAVAIYYSTRSRPKPPDPPDELWSQGIHTPPAAANGVTMDTSCRGPDGKSLQEILKTSESFDMASASFGDAAAMASRRSTTEDWDQGTTISGFAKQLRIPPDAVASLLNRAGSFDK